MSTDLEIEEINMKLLHGTAQVSAPNRNTPMFAGKTHYFVNQDVVCFRTMHHHVYPFCEARYNFRVCLRLHLLETRRSRLQLGQRRLL